MSILAGVPDAKRFYTDSPVLRYCKQALIAGIGVSQIFDALANLGVVKREDAAREIIRLPFYALPTWDEQELIVEIVFDCFKP